MTIKEDQTTTNLFEKLRAIGCVVKGGSENFHVQFPDGFDPSLLHDESVPKCIKDGYDLINTKNRESPSVELISKGFISEVNERDIASTI